MIRLKCVLEWSSGWQVGVIEWMAGEDLSG